MSTRATGAADEYRINFSWLLRLRWGVIVGRPCS